MSRLVTKLAATAALAAFVLAGAATDALSNGRPEGAGGGGRAAGRPTKGRSDLTPPEGAADLDAFGRCDVKHFGAVGHRVERSWLRVKVRHLDAGMALTLWMDDPTTPDDPTLVQVVGADFTTSDEGAANERIDTKHGDTLPFGATLADLAGKAIEVRNADGSVTVLAGTVPAAQ